MSGPIRAGVCGVGHLGRIHARIYSELRDTELVCVVDPDEVRGRAVAAEFGTEWASDAERLADRVDVVSVATPTVRHAETALPLLEAGVSCLVEKPFAASLEEADRMMAAAGDSGARLAVGHVERFNPVISVVRDLDSAPRFVEVHRLAPFSFRSVDVGVVLDLMIHDLDILLAVIDSPIETVDAVGGSILTRSEDMVSARLRFANGCVANLTASRVSLEPMRRIRIFSSESYVSLDFHKRYALCVRKGPRWDDSAVARLAESPPALADGDASVFGDLLEVQEMEIPDHEPLVEEIRSFAAAVRDGTPMIVGATAGRAALEAALRVREALDESTWKPGP